MRAIWLTMDLHVVVTESLIVIQVSLQTSQDRPIHQIKRSVYPNNALDLKPRWPILEWFVAVGPLHRDRPVLAAPGTMIPGQLRVA